MLGYFTLLFIGLIIQQVRFMFEPRIAAFGVGFTVFLVAVLIFAYPYYVVRIRRARRYARDHPALLESDDEPVTS
jgi:energy-converting hydrogenase Eha subunit C